MNRVHGLDILKAICAFCVIVIHAPFPGKIGEYALALSRIAVPVFFMITGYFYSARSREKKGAQIKRIFMLCLFANGLYFLWGLFAKFCAGGGKISADLLPKITVKSLLGFLFLNESPFAGHLWYLGALLYVLLLVGLLERVCPKRFDAILLAATPLLLSVNFVFGGYSHLLLQRAYSHLLTRNFLCVGIPYFTIGLYLGKYKRIVTALRTKRALLIFATLFFLLTTVTEAYLLGRLGVGSTREHYLSTPFLSILVFSAFASPHQKEKLQFLYDIGKRHSTNIYILHPIVIAVSDGIFRRLPLYSIFLSVRPIAVCLGTLLLSMLLCKLQAAVRGKRGRHGENAQAGKA